MTISQIAAEEKTNQSLQECARNFYCQEVMEFLERHHRTWFSREAIVNALGSYRLCVEKALDYLADNGIIRRSLKNSVLLYSLRME